MHSCLILRRSGNAAVDRQMSQKAFDFGRLHLPGVAFAVKEDKAADPLDVSVLGADAVMLEPDAIPHLVQQTRLGWQHGHSP